MRTVGVATLRRLSQCAFFLLTGHWLLMGFLRCPFGVPFVSCLSCPLGDCSGRFLFIPVVGLLAVSAIFLGRAFCGWMCPLGYIQDVLSWLRPRVLGRWHLSIPGRSVWLPWLKVGLLSLVVYWVLVLNILPDRAHPYVVRSPTAGNWESIMIAWRLGSWRYPIRGVLLLAILLMGLFVPRFWCRYLCPLGILLSVANRVSIFRVHKSIEACTNCGKYPRECPQGTTPGTGDCTVCGDCVSGCPVGAVSLQRSRARGEQPDVACSGGERDTGAC